jgi:thioredoxin
MTIRIMIVLLTIALSACSSNAASDGHSGTTIPAAAFRQLMHEKKEWQLLDVRTKQEYTTEHLQDAVNVDYNSNDFKEQLAAFDKTKPTFIYCLSGGRSGNALNVMQEMGFTEVYNMQGGILKWKAENLPLASASNATANEWIGMTKEAYADIINSKVPVLIDFNAKWCGPCKQLKPILEEIQREYQGKINIVPIDIDVNKSLARSMYVNSIPLLVYHVNGKVVMNQEGFLDKPSLVQLLKLNEN